MANQDETDQASTAFDRLDTAMKRIPPVGEMDPAALAILDQVMDAADRAIESAQRVFVSDATRTRLAALRAELYGRPVCVEPADERTRPADVVGRVDVSAANVMVGLVERALRELGEEPAEWDALELVRSWLERSQRGEDNTDGAFSALHLIASERATPIVRVPDAMLDDSVARLPLAQWQALLTVFGSALASRSAARR